MNKREYAKANLEWLAAKAQEDGVMALPRGIYYKVLSQGNADGKHPTPRSIVTAHYTGRTINGKKFDSSRGELHWLCACATLSRVGSLPCSRCALATNGRSTSLPTWVTASSRSLESPAAQRLFSR